MQNPRSWRSMSLALILNYSQPLFFYKRYAQKRVVYVILIFSARNSYISVEFLQISERVIAAISGSPSTFSAFCRFPLLPIKQGQLGKGC